VLGFDNVRQVQVTGFIVHKPWVLLFATSKL
jgi:ribulose bisphosphate carboxylase small subunit